MALTTVDNSATISTTEYSLPNNSTTLTPQTDDCELEVWLDLSAIALGDEYEFKVYEKVAGSGATQRLALPPIRVVGPCSGSLAEYVIPRLIVAHGWDVTAKKIAGTDRSIGWSLRKIAYPANFSAMSITAGGLVDITQTAADKVWSTAARTLTAFGFSVTVGTNNDKTGYALSAAGVQAIWDALTSALATAGSIGKLIVDNLNATVSSRASQASVDTVDDFLDTEIAAIKSQTDLLTFTGTNLNARVKALDASVIDAASVATDVGEEFADALLGRNVAGGSNTGRLVRWGFYRLVNRVKITLGLATIYQTDDTTAAFTQNVTTAAGDPINEVDTN